MSNNDFVTQGDFKDFTKEEQRLRHKQNSEITKYLMSPKECSKEKEIALLELEDTHIMKTLTEFKDSLKEYMEHGEKSMDGIHKSIEDLRTEMKNDFATKADHKNNSQRISKIEKGVWWIIALVASILISSLVYTVIKL